MELPRDVELILLSKMDIDTRRALGVYSRLDVPLALKELITTTFGKVTFAQGYACVRLGPRRFIDDEGSHGDSMYILVRDCVHGLYYVEHIGVELNEDETYYNMYCVESYC